MVTPLSLISAIQWKKKKSMQKERWRRKRRRRNRDDLIKPDIPLDLIIEILARLPATSLMRFKCVSKLWSRLILSRYFTNLYLNVASPTPPLLYMSLVYHIVCESKNVCHNPRESVLLSLSQPSCSSKIAKSLHQDLGFGGRNMVVLRGLILYIVCRKACVYNPTTRQCLTLPAVKSNLFCHKGYHRRRFLYFLGHDHVLDQYKVICTVVIYSKRFEMITSEHWVFVLEAGGFWKRIEFDHQPHFPTRLGLCINGIIYYLASTCMSRDIIVSFDVRSEEFNTIQGPADVVSAYGESVGFIEYEGKPTILDHTLLDTMGLVDLWVLEDGCKWSRKSIVLQPCQMHLVAKEADGIVLTVEGTTQNGEVILAPRSLINPYYVLYYDLHKNDLRKVRIKGIPDHWFAKHETNLFFFFKLMNKRENIIHFAT